MFIFTLILHIHISIVHTTLRALEGFALRKFSAKNAWAAQRLIWRLNGRWASAVETVEPEQPLSSRNGTINQRAKIGASADDSSWHDW